MSIPSRFDSDNKSDVSFSGDTSTTGMVLIPSGIFDMGGDNNQASPDEFPKHKVQVSPFYIDITEVTNAQFKKFIDATGYVTTAEQQPDWEELKKSVPPGTPKPPDSVLVAASLVFNQTAGPVNPPPWFGVSRMKRMDSSFQCCIKDGSRSTTYAVQTEYVNHLKVLCSKGMVLNVQEKLSVKSAGECKEAERK